jgi:hypothetical protein
MTGGLAITLESSCAFTQSMKDFFRLARDGTVITRLFNRRGFGGGYVPIYVPKTLVYGLVARFGLRSGGKPYHNLATKGA